jgi:hypothetical protein
MQRPWSILKTTVLALSGGGVLFSPALAQSPPARGGAVATYEAGYGNGRQMESRTYGPSSNAQAGNRLIVNGIIQSDSSNYFEADGNKGDQSSSGDAAASGGMPGSGAGAAGKGKSKKDAEARAAAEALRARLWDA